MTDLHLERCSAAYTLSDLELAVFPELVQALVLANAVSPAVWRWKREPFLRGILKKSPVRRVHRLRQFVMQRFSFNLDLHTWGLTTKSHERRRFERWLPAGFLEQVSPFYGCPGECFYFESGLREHFGLSDYPDDVIPTWKTETVEAMEAFRFREGFRTGAGECVSFAALYAAALFVVAQIPLETIYLLLTPLHAQGFVDLGDGLLINNRRVLSRTMWINGTPLSQRARRALEREQVSVVSHVSGWAHTSRPAATIEPRALTRLRTRLGRFTKSRLRPESFLGFLRTRPDLQPRFAVGSEGARLEELLQAERDGHGCASRRERPTLLTRVRPTGTAADRLDLEDLERKLERFDCRLDRPEHRQRLREALRTPGLDTSRFVSELAGYLEVRPRLPGAGSGEPSTWRPEPGSTREDLLWELRQRAVFDLTAELALHVHRDVRSGVWAPLLHAALRRSPVIQQAARGWRIGEVARRLEALPDQSIYDGPGRLAQPDELWNFGRGDGVEKAIALATVIAARRPGETLRLHVDRERAVLRAGSEEHRFPSSKMVMPAQLELGRADPTAAQHPVRHLWRVTPAGSDSCSRRGGSAGSPGGRPRRG